MTTKTEVINGNTYLVTRDNLGAIVDMLGATPGPVLLVISKSDYRNLFTTAERQGIDGFQANAALSAAQKLQLGSSLEDLRASTDIDLKNPAVIAATNLFEALALIAVGRAAQVLANQPHP